MKLKGNIAISESGFVFDSSTGESYNLNSVGKDILNLMKENKSEEDTKRQILQDYDVEPEALESSYYDFTRMLSQFNLIEHEK